MRKNTTALIILDGFGHQEAHDHNAISLAQTPHLDQYWQQYSHTLISGSGHEVGLPDGQMGNSEVGHLNIGAGRLVPQELTRISQAIETGDFTRNKVLLEACLLAKQNQRSLHVFGLLSQGGVHSHEDHLLTFLQLAKAQGVTRLYLHAFLDGRDTAPKCALASIQKFEAAGFTIASITGRYYAMDRDQRWERIQACYDALTLGKAPFHFDSAEAALAAAYERGETDEFVQPSLMHSATISDDDVICFMNFRSDRARQLTRAFIEEDIEGFTKTKSISPACFVTLTEYHADFNVRVAFPPFRPKNTLGEYISSLGLKQLRIAETEKYAHVTFFFNGGVETPFSGEDRELIPSPKVDTYDLQPEMNAPLLTDKLVAAINKEEYDLIICNYANPDMVGHTGNLKATIQAIECIDTCIGRVVEALQAKGGEAIITADHGNAECMFNEATGQPHTAHTSEPVPVYYIGRPATVVKNRGALSDLAPTILTIMGLEIPEEMTGSPLFTIN